MAQDVSIYSLCELRTSSLEKIDSYLGSGWGREIINEGNGNIAVWAYDKNIYGKSELQIVLQLGDNPATPNTKCLFITTTKHLIYSKFRNEIRNKYKYIGLIENIEVFDQSNKDYRIMIFQAEEFGKTFYNIMIMWQP